MNFELGGGLDDAFDAGGIVDAGELDEDLIVAQTVLRDLRFRDAERVDPGADGLDRLLQGSCFDVANGRLFHGQGEAVAPGGGDIIGRVLVAIEDVVNGRCLRGLKAVDGDEGGVICGVELGGFGAGGRQRGIEALHVGIGPGGDGFGDLNLEHEMGAALEVEPEMDAVRERLLEAAVRDAEDAVDEDHHHRDDEACFSGQILTHCLHLYLANRSGGRPLGPGVLFGTTEAMPFLLPAARFAGMPGCLRRPMQGSLHGADRGQLRSR